MSDYFDSSSYQAVPGTRARASDLNTALDALNTGLAKLPSEVNIKRGLINYAVDAGAADAYVVTLTYAPTSYTDGMEVVFKASAANTGDATINVNSLGVKSIKRQNGDALAAGDIPANKIMTLRYNSTSGYFEIQGVGATGSGTMAAQSAGAVAITGGTIKGITAESNTGAVVTVDGIQTLSGKTLTLPKLNEDVALTLTASQLNDILFWTEKRAKFTWNGVPAFAINLGAAMYHVKDKVAQWVSLLTVTGTGTLLASTWYYLYLDYSAITSWANLTADAFYLSTTAPTKNETYGGGFYNGDDLCIFAALTNPAATNFLEWIHDGGELVGFATLTEEVNPLVPSNTWVDVDCSGTAPGFSTKLLAAFSLEYVDAAATAGVRVNGQTGAIGLLAGTVAAASIWSTCVLPVFCDSSQIIEVQYSIATNNKISVFGHGWYFPAGM